MHLWLLLAKICLYILPLNANTTLSADYQNWLKHVEQKAMAQLRTIMDKSDRFMHSREPELHQALQKVQKAVSGPARVGLPAKLMALQHFENVKLQKQLREKLQFVESLVNKSDTACMAYYGQLIKQMARALQGNNEQKKKEFIDMEVKCDKKTHRKSKLKLKSVMANLAKGPVEVLLGKLNTKFNAILEKYKDRPDYAANNDEFDKMYNLVNQGIKMGPYEINLKQKVYAEFLLYNTYRLEFENQITKKLKVVGDALVKNEMSENCKQHFLNVRETLTKFVTETNAKKRELLRFIKLDCPPEPCPTDGEGDSITPPKPEETLAPDNSSTVKECSEDIFPKLLKEIVDKYAKRPENSANNGEFEDMMKDVKSALDQGNPTVQSEAYKNFTVYDNLRKQLDEQLKKKRGKILNKSEMDKESEECRQYYKDLLPIYDKVMKESNNIKFNKLWESDLECPHAGSCKAPETGDQPPTSQNPESACDDLITTKLKKLKEQYKNRPNHTANNPEFEQMMKAVDEAIPLSPKSVDQKTDALVNFTLYDKKRKDLENEIGLQLGKIKDKLATDISPNCKSRYNDMVKELEAAFTKTNEEKSRILNGLQLDCTSQTPDDDLITKKLKNLKEQYKDRPSHTANNPEFEEIMKAVDEAILLSRENLDQKTDALVNFTLYDKKRKDLENEIGLQLGKIKDKLATDVSPDCQSPLKDMVKELEAAFIKTNEEKSRILKGLQLDCLEATTQKPDNELITTKLQKLKEQYKNRPNHTANNPQFEEMMKAVDEAIPMSPEKLDHKKKVYDKFTDYDKKRTELENEIGLQLGKIKDKLATDVSPDCQSPLKDMVKELEAAFIKTNEEKSRILKGLQLDCLEATTQKPDNELITNKLKQLKEQYKNRPNHTANNPQFEEMMKAVDEAIPMSPEKLDQKKKVYDKFTDYDKKRTELENEIGLQLGKIKDKLATDVSPKCQSNLKDMVKQLEAAFIKTNEEKSRILKGLQLDCLEATTQKPDNELITKKLKQLKEQYKNRPSHTAKNPEFEGMMKAVDEAIPMSPEKLDQKKKVYDKFTDYDKKRIELENEIGLQLGKIKDKLATNVSPGCQSRFNDMLKELQAAFTKTNDEKSSILKGLQLDCAENADNDLITKMLKQLKEQYKNRPSHTAKNHEFEGMMKTVDEAIPMSAEKLEHKRKVYDQFTDYDKKRIELENEIGLQLGKIKDKLATNVSPGCQSRFNDMLKELQAAFTKTNDEKSSILKGLQWDCAENADDDLITKKLKQLREQYKNRPSHTAKNSEFEEMMKVVDEAIPMSAEKLEHKKKVYDQFTDYDKTRIELENEIGLQLRKIKDKLATKVSPGCQSHFNDMVKELQAAFIKTNDEKSRMLKGLQYDCSETSTQSAANAADELITKRLKELQVNYKNRPGHTANNLEFDALMKIVDEAIPLGSEFMDLKTEIYANFTGYDKKRIELEGAIQLQLTKLKGKLATNVSAHCKSHYEAMIKTLQAAFTKPNDKKSSILETAQLDCVEATTEMVTEVLSTAKEEETTTQPISAEPTTQPMTQSPQEEGTLSDFDVANRICGEELLGPVVRRRGPALPTKRINWLPHPSDDLCTIQLKRFIHKYRLRPNNTKANHEFEQRIWTVYMTLDLNRGSIKEKARVYNEFLKYDKLRLYLDSILEAKIHECEVRLADSPSASCKKTLMRAKNEFRGALKAAISDKQKAIAKNSMICETGDENYY